MSMAGYQRTYFVQMKGHEPVMDDHSGGAPINWFEDKSMKVNEQGRFTMRQPPMSSFEFTERN